MMVGYGNMLLITNIEPIILTSSQVKSIVFSVLQKVLWATKAAKLKIGNRKKVRF